MIIRFIFYAEFANDTYYNQVPKFAGSLIFLFPFFKYHFSYTDLIVAAGDQLEFLTDGSAYRSLTLSSYNATKLSALAYDATTQKLYFSDRHHHYGHIFSVSLGDESSRPVEDIVESNLYDPIIIT